MTERNRLVYKYSGPSGGLAILTSRMIYLTRPSAFNDPFDLKPHFATTVYARIGDGRPRVFPAMQVIDRETELKIRNTVVLSLAGNPTSILMWGYYAAGHTGLAIGFQPGVEILADSSPHRTFDSVTYSAERPSKPTAMDLSDEEVWLTKSLEWKHEDESRLIDSHYSADEDYAVNSEGNRDAAGPHWRFRIRPDRVREVILGCRADLTLETDVMRVLQEPDYLHVRLLRSEPDERRYRINQTEIPRGDWK